MVKQLSTSFMKHSFIAVIGVLIAGIAAPLPGQAPTRQPGGAPQIPSGNGEVRGTIVESEGSRPLSRAAIAVRSKRDSSLVSGAIAGDDGSFKVSGLRPGSYYLRVTKIGYGPRAQDFSISDASPRVAIGSVRMGRVAVALSGVEIVAERATMTIEPDRNAYRAKDVAPAATNASEVLDAVPSVSIDGDGKVSFRGNENVAVQINGRVSPMRGTQLGSFLKQLPSGIVERIEVIPNPSAKYDPEGMAGIINIVLKENADLGVSGGFTAGAATADRFNTTGNLGYQAGNLTTFTSYGYNSDLRDVVGINERERFNASGLPLSFTNQDIVEQQMNAGHNFTGTADYKLNNRDVLTNALIANRRRGSGDSRTAYEVLNGSQVLIDQYDRTKSSSNTGTMLDYTLALKRTLEPRKHEISSEIRFNSNGEDDRTSLWKLPLSSGGTVDGEIDKTDAVTRQLTQQLDYTRSLAPRTKLETGYKGTERWLDRDYLVTKDALGTGVWVKSSLSNDFKFNDQVQAAYGVLSHGVGNFDLQGGLRAEYANRDFTLSSTNQNYPYNYTSFFPSGVVSYKKSEMTNLKASYSRRVRRPGTQELNPFPTFFDAQNVFIGNPKLSPEYTDAVELGLTRSGQLYTLQFSPFYRRTANVIRVDINTDDVIDGRSVTSVTFRNLKKSDSWGTDLNGQLRLGKKFNGLASVNVYKIVTDGGSETSLSSNAITWSGRVNGNAQINETLTLSGMYSYRAPTRIEKGRFGAFQMANVSLRQKVMGDKGAVTLRLVDPFNTLGMKIRTGNDQTIQVSERRFGARGAFLSFQYNIGQAPRIRQPQPQEQAPQTGFPSGG